jgi:hypothetical protein
MVMTLAIVVLAIVLIVGYAVGVRQNAAWGKPLVVVCTVAILALLGVRFFANGGGRPSVVSTVPAKAGFMQKLGEVLAGRVDPGGTVLAVVWSEPGMSVDSATTAEWEQQLRAGGTDASLTVVSHMDDTQVNAELKNSTADGVIVVGLLPMETVVPDDVPVAVYTRSLGDSALVQEHLKSGVVAAVVVGEGANQQVYTPQNLPQ